MGDVDMSEQPARSPDVHIFIPMLPPASGSPNARVHWSRRYSERKAFMAQVGLAILSVGCKDMRWAKAVVGIEYLVKIKRRRDADNWHARGKPILDALVNLGVLRDDSVEHVRLLQPDFTVNPELAPASVVRIWEVKP